MSSRSWAATSKASAFQGFCYPRLLLPKAAAFRLTAAASISAVRSLSYLFSQLSVVNSDARDAVAAKGGVIRRGYVLLSPFFPKVPAGFAALPAAGRLPAAEREGRAALPAGFAACGLLSRLPAALPSRVRLLQQQQQVLTAERCRGAMGRGSRCFPSSSSKAGRGRRRAAGCTVCSSSSSTRRGSAAAGGRGGSCPAGSRHAS